MYKTINNLYYFESDEIVVHKSWKCVVEYNQSQQMYVNSCKLQKQTEKICKDNIT